MRRIARPHEVVAQMRGDKTRSVDDMLAELFNNFILAARAIDPTITRQWVGKVVMPDGQSGLPSYVAFERGGDTSAAPSDHMRIECSTALRTEGDA